ncbi:MAG: hypothetical protein KJ000_20090 [Pirellulaceae bacterium]|nr:hypothetical protein [Pirellulaceae bacterium]
MYSLHPIDIAAVVVYLRTCWGGSGLPASSVRDRWSACRWTAPGKLRAGLRRGGGPACGRPGGAANPDDFGWTDGARVDGIIRNWLIPAPDANPGMLEMMRLRDRQPPHENPVPWGIDWLVESRWHGIRKSVFL